jgi:hypothetical protein
MKLVVEVTEEDIILGKRKRSCECPISKALKRSTGFDWGVGINTALYFGPEFSKNSFIELPKEARDFISKFDQEKPVKPFKFEIEY